jgi:hypothetical protein
LKKRTSGVLLDELLQLVMTIENLQESDFLSHHENESKARPTFKPWTEEEKEASRQYWDEAARKASEAMKRGDHPNN